MRFSYLCIDVLKDEADGHKSKFLRNKMLNYFYLDTLRCASIKVATERRQAVATFLQVPK
jgi:hypothetical protein